jgi:2-polyprenyl-3-methyl-5-hydroxy-6-metoxy-1,4-benzoquinol methylase
LTAGAAGDAAGRRDALADRLFGGVLGMIDVHMAHVGDRLGLYRALADGAATAAELAAAAAIDERYAREWLEQQAVSEILECANPGDDEGARRYRLPDGHDEVLLDRDSGAYMAAFARMMVGIVRPLPAVIEAFRSGGGVPYADFDNDFCEGQGDMNRVQFVNELGATWLPGMPDVDERLRSDPPARVADVACGTGWSSIAIARAYPGVRVDGIDLDEHSIALARENVEREGLGDRVDVAVRDAADPELAGRYDLVTIFEAVHDLARPVQVLRACRGLLADGGSVFIADERVAERFTAPGDDVERVMYGFSVLHCLPTARVEADSAATGTAMRPETLREYATEAGYSDVEVLSIENDFWRFYRLRP